MTAHFSKIMMLLLFVVKGVVSIAQQDLTLFLMHDLPHANFVNPAVTPRCPVIIGVPGLSTFHTNYSNTAFTVKEVFVSENDSLYLSPDEVIDQMNGKELLAAETHYTPLYVGLWVKNSYWTFALTEKVYTYNIYNQNAAQLLWEGNYPAFTGSTASLDGVRANVNHYREYAVGWAKQTSDLLQIGIRGKLLFGKGNIYTPRTKGGLYTNERTFAMDLNLDSKVYSSFPLDVTTDEDGYVTDIAVRDDVDWARYMMNKKNIGLGFDFGLIYQWNEKTTLSASILDIGFINWKTDVNKFVSEGSFQYRGTDTDGDFNNPDYIENIGDSLQRVFVPQPISAGYVSPLLPQLYVGATRTFTNHINGGAVFRNEFYRNRLHPSFTLSANTFDYEVLNVSLSYSMINGDYMNLGMGFGAKLGVIHLHAVSDNILSFFDLSNTRGINLRMGISIIPGCGEEKERKKSSNGVQPLPCHYNPYTRERKK